MPELKHNKDETPPGANTYIDGPVYSQSFANPSRLPIFWGPWQFTNYPDYTKPDRERWRKDEMLHIPQVCRFIYAVEEDHADDDYTDDDSPPSPPSPPFSCPGYRYQAVNPAYSGKLKLEYWFNTTQLYYCEFNSPAPPGGNFGASGIGSSIISKDAAESATITIYRNGTNEVVYNGSFLGSSYLDYTKFRSMEWFRICFGSGLPPEGSSTFVGSFFTSSAPWTVPITGVAVPWTDFNDPPVCWIKMIPVDPSTGLPAWNGSYTSEVPFEAHNWYGCNETPGSPPVTPPSPPYPPGP